jgi:flagellar motor switch protein FliG
MSVLQGSVSAVVPGQLEEEAHASTIERLRLYDPVPQDFVQEVHAVHDEYVQSQAPRSQVDVS